jgi:hypothetical protein
MPDDQPFNPPRLSSGSSTRPHHPVPELTNRIPYHPRGFNKRSKQRFARDRITQLTHHLGRQPSYPERILISRIVAVEWDLKRIDAKLDAGQEISGHAMRARLAGENRLRLDLRELGLAPTAAPAASLDDISRDIARRRPRSAA